MKNTRNEMVKLVAELTKAGFEVSNSGKLVAENKKSGQKINLGIKADGTISYKIATKGSMNVSDIAILFKSNEKPSADIIMAKVEQSRRTDDSAKKKLADMEKAMGWNLQKSKKTPKMIDVEIAIYRANNPSGSKCSCARHTGIAYKVVSKHWDGTWKSVRNYKADEVFSK